MRPVEVQECGELLNELHQCAVHESNCRPDRRLSALVWDQWVRLSLAKKSNQATVPAGVEHRHKQRRVAERVELIHDGAPVEEHASRIDRTLLRREMQRCEALCV